MRVKGFLKVDLHIHTDRSKCSNMRPETVVAKARAAGLDVIGVTDHNDIRGGLAVRKIAKGMLVIPGEEISADFGDLLVFPSDGKYRGTIEEICERARSKGALVIAPHPFDSTRNGIGERAENIAKYLDAVETFNGRVMLRQFNRKASEFASRHGIPQVAGSDSHFAGEIGGCYNLLRCDRNIEAVFGCIRKGGAKMVVNKVSPALRHAQTFSRMIRKAIG